MTEVHPTLQHGPLAGVSTREVIEVLRSTDDRRELASIIAGLEAELVWSPWPYQLAPAGDWSVWLFLGGRFTGKTDTDAHWMNEHALGPPCDRRLRGGHRMSIVAPTLGDAAESCVNGPSGLRAHNPDVVMVTTTGGTIVRWPNGAEAKLFGASDANAVERFRAGGNRCACWMEEAAAMPALEAVYEQIPFSHRLGHNPQVVISTTPKPRPLLKRLKGYAAHWRPGAPRPESRWERVVYTQASSADNPAIDPDVVAGLYDLHGGTRFGRQELEGELLDDYDGALWNRERLEQHRIEAAALPPLMRRMVGVDPSTWGVKLDSSYEEDKGEIARGIETGIVVTGIAADRQCYTLADRSKRCSPAEWADRVLDAYWDWSCSDIVFETNAGGAMGPSIIQAQEKLRRLEHPDLTLQPVRFYRQTKTRLGVMAADGKRARAEPVAALGENGRHHMVGVHPLLEDQLCGWDPNEPWSPDRLDALVWSVTALNPFAGVTRSSLGAGRRGSVTR